MSLLTPEWFLSLHPFLVFATFLLSSVVGLFVFVVGYLHSQHVRYQHVPGPIRDSFFSGNMITIARKERKYNKKNICEIWMDWHLQFGSVFVFWVYHTAVVMIIEPEAVKEVLITMNLPKAPRIYNIISYCYGQRLVGNGILTELNHEAWKERRALLNQAFHRTYLMNLMSSFNSTCDVFMEKMGQSADNGNHVKMTDEFARVTLDVIGKVGFDINTNAIDDPNSPFPIAISQALEGLQSAFRNPFWRVKFWNFQYQNKVTKAITYLRKFAESVINTRLEKLQRKDNNYKDVLAYILTKAEGNSEYSMDKLVDDFGTFFIAGQETTSNQLSFTLYEILSNPDIEKRILSELEEVLGTRQFVEYQDLGKLRYLGMTLKESLRMHPPITGTQRVLLQQATFNGYSIPAMTPIGICYFVTQNSPDYWENPDVFDPERFSSENKIHRSSTHYLPFSAGPRTCIGKTLAEFEARLIMARLLQKFKLELVPGQTLSIIEQLTIKPRDGVICKITRRN